MPILDYRLGSDNKGYYFIDGILINSEENDYLRMKSIKERRNNEQKLKNSSKEERIKSLKNELFSLIENNNNEEIDISSLYKEFNDIITSFSMFLGSIGYEIYIQRNHIWDFFKDEKVFLRKIKLR